MRVEISRRKLERLSSFKIRTLTLGVNVLDCSSHSFEEIRWRLKEKIVNIGSRFSKAVDEEAKSFANELEGIGIKFGGIQTKRIALSPISMILAPAISRSIEEGLKFEEIAEEIVLTARTIDKAAAISGLDFIGGWTALVEGGMSSANWLFISSIPEVLAETQRLNSSIVVGSSRNGINSDACMLASEVIVRAALSYTEVYSPRIERISADGVERVIYPVKSPLPRLSIMVNAPYDNPFFSGGFHGPSMPDMALNVGMAGPGLLKQVIDETISNKPGCSHDFIGLRIKHNVTIMASIAERLRVRICKRMEFEEYNGGVDLSLAPTFGEDSIAEILKSLGVGEVGAPGTLAALFLVVNSVKKGGVSAVLNPAGLSGTFIPLTEDEGMSIALEKGSLDMGRYLAMTAVCNVGIDMYLRAWSRDVDPVLSEAPVGLKEEPLEVTKPRDGMIRELKAVVCGDILDALSIGNTWEKPMSVRVILVPKIPKERVVGGKKYRVWVGLKGTTLFGAGPVMDLPRTIPSGFVRRNGRIPAPLTSMRG
ncbi:MAG TPA: DUF711 family protein [Candidatus Korarchaeota archaeon]|nr:DUF711 family protein [Candidatus Korarchaeota archaeon]